MTFFTLAQRIIEIKLLVLDMDGVLSDGRIIYNLEGREFKVFDIKDGHGVKLLIRAHIEVVILSGRVSVVNQIQAKELGIGEVYQGVRYKLPVFKEIITNRGLNPVQVAYMGDDLVDLAPMCLAGLSCAPSDALPEVRAIAHWVSQYPGGRGAVRQVCELILRGLGKWEQIIENYFK